MAQDKELRWQWAEGQGHHAETARGGGGRETERGLGKEGESGVRPREEQEIEMGNQNQGHKHVGGERVREESRTRLGVVRGENRGERERVIGVTIASHTDLKTRKAVLGTTQVPEGYSKAT